MSTPRIAVNFLWLLVNWSLKILPVAARYKAWVGGRSLAGILGFNPAGGMDVCLLWVLYCRGLCVGLITRPEESYRVWYVWVWSRILDNEVNPVIPAISDSVVMCQTQWPAFITHCHLFWAGTFCIHPLLYLKIPYRHSQRVLVTYISVYSSRSRHTQTLPNKQPWINTAISSDPKAPCLYRGQGIAHQSSSTWIAEHVFRSLRLRHRVRVFSVEYVPSVTEKTTCRY